MHRIEAGTHLAQHLLESVLPDFTVEKALGGQTEAGMTDQLIFLGSRLQSNDLVHGLLVAQNSWARRCRVVGLVTALVFTLLHLSSPCFAEKVVIGVQQGVPGDGDKKVLRRPLGEIDVVRIRELHHITETFGDRIWPGFDTRGIPVAINTTTRKNCWSAIQTRRRSSTDSRIFVCTASQS